MVVPLSLSPSLLLCARLYEAHAHLFSHVELNGYSVSSNLVRIVTGMMMYRGAN